jgi:hypothetical protein
MAARAVRLAMAKLVATRTEVKAAAAVDVARAAAAELEALRCSSISSSVPADGGTDDELKLARGQCESRRHSGQPRTPRGAVVAAQMGAEAPVALRVRARATVMPPMAMAAQTGADAPMARSKEIVAFTGSVNLPPRTGTMVTMGSRPLSGMSVSAAAGPPSSRPTTSSGPRC